MTITVEFNYECPFHYEKEVVYSECTVGDEDKCALLKKDCCGTMNGECPLKNGQIIVEFCGDRKVMENSANGDNGE